MKVSLGIVHGSEVNGWFFHSMVDLLNKNNPTEHVFDDHVCVRSGPLLSAGRGILAGQFLAQSDADALLMLDADMRFEVLTIFQMVDLFARLKAEHANLGMLGGLAFISLR